MVFKLNAADPTAHQTALGKMMTAQQIHSSTDPVRASENPGAMTVAQIDQALRDFVLQDTAHLRRDARTASQDSSRAGPESTPQKDSEFVRQMAGDSLNKLDQTIVDLSQLRDFLHAEGERIKREISGFLQFSQVAMGSTKLVVDNIARCRAAEAAIAPRLEKRPAESE
jgi:hypothetical protein